MDFKPLDSAKRLTELRVERKITLRKFAEKAGINPVILCDIEHGRKIPDIELLGAICNVLNLNKDEKASILHGFGYME